MITTKSNTTPVRLRCSYSFEKVTLISYVILFLLVILDIGVSKAYSINYERWVEWGEPDGSGTGSQTSPKKFSNAESFTQFLCDHCNGYTIHYSAQTFLTKGYFYEYRQTVGSNNKHIGATNLDGTPATTIKLVGATHPTADGVIFGANDGGCGTHLRDVEIRNFILDCNASGNDKYNGNNGIDPQGSCNAIRFMGTTNILLKNLHIKGFGVKKVWDSEKNIYRGYECIPVLIEPLSHMSNVIMEYCTFCDPATDNDFQYYSGVTCAGIGPTGNEQTYATENVIIRHCIASNLRPYFYYSHGFNAPLTEYNYVTNCEVGVYLEPGSNVGFERTFRIENNTFEDVDFGVQIRHSGTGGHIRTILVSTNVIILTKHHASDGHPWCQAYSYYKYTNPSQSYVGTPSSAFSIDTYNNNCNYSGQTRKEREG